MERIDPDGDVFAAHREQKAHEFAWRHGRTDYSRSAFLASAFVAAVLFFGAASVATSGRYDVLSGAEAFTSSIARNATELFSRATQSLAHAIASISHLPLFDKNSPATQPASAAQAFLEPSSPPSSAPPPAATTTLGSPPSTGNTPSPAKTTIVNNYITRPVIERVVQVNPFSGTVLGTSTDATAAKITDLQNQINALSHAPQQVFVPSFTGPAASTPVSTATFASSQRIDSLTDITVHGVSGLTTSDIPSLSGSYLPLSGGAITGNTFLGGSTNTITGFNSVNFINDIAGGPDPNEVDGESPSIALGSDGLPRISFAIDSSPSSLRFARCLNADCSSVATTTVDSAEFSQSNTTSLVMGSDGFARIGYTALTNNKIKFARCSNANCTSVATTTVDNIVSPTLSYDSAVSIALGSDGFARMSYISGDTIRFARCLNANCTSVATTTVASSVGVTFAQPSLALGTDGNAQISYYDYTNQTLKFARCLNANCTSVATTTLDNAGNGSANGTALAIGSDGFARIGYTDANTGQLKFARCTNLNCTSVASTTLETMVVNNAGKGGQYPSIAIGSDGLPRITFAPEYKGTVNGIYLDAPVKFFRCLDANCATTSSIIVSQEGDTDYGPMALTSDDSAYITYNEEGTLKITKLTKTGFTPSGNDTFVAGALAVKSGVMTDSSLSVGQGAIFNATSTFAGNSVFNANVGIGISSPKANLHIANASEFPFSRQPQLMLTDLFGKDDGSGNNDENSVAFPNAYLYLSNGLLRIGKANNSYNKTNLLTVDGSGNVINSGNATIINSTDASTSFSVMAAAQPGTGTISAMGTDCASGYVAGSGTAFTTQLRVGDAVIDQFGASGIVTEIDDNSNMYLTSNLICNVANMTFTYKSASRAALTVLPGGNVGIGTTIPDPALWEASGILGIQGDKNRHGNGILELIGNAPDASGNFAGTIDFVSPSNTQGNEIAQINAFTTGSSATDRGGRMEFGIKGNNANESGDLNTAMTIDSTGHVGIGTTTPSWPLTSTSATSPQLALTDGSSGDKAWTFRNVGGILFIATSTATATSSKSALEVDANGNLIVAGPVVTCTIGNGTSATNCSSSDQRLKDNIAPLDASSSLAAIQALNSVSFNWNAWMVGNGASTSTQFGFIAQNVFKIFPNLVSQDVNTGYYKLDYQGLIAPIVQAIQAIVGRLAALEKTVAGFAESFTSHRGTFTDQLCVGDTCVTPDQFKAMAAAASASSATSSPIPTTSTTTTTSSAVTAPTISINGANPAHIQVGDTYADPGATITGPQTDLDLGIRTFLNGTLVSNIIIDTSQAATDTVQYVATDSASNTATSTRTVIVETAAAPSQSPSEATAPSTP